MSLASRAARFAACLGLFLLPACATTTELTVRDPGLVGVGAKDASGQWIDLAGDGKPGEASGIVPPPKGFAFGGNVQHLTLIRDASNTLRFEAPDTPGAEHGTLMRGDGRIVVPPSYLGADNVEREGDEALLRDLVWQEIPSYRRVRRIPSFELWIHTPLTNVTSAQVRTTPIRGFGVLLACVGGVFAAMSAITFAATRGNDGRLGAALFGGFGLTFGAGGVVLLTAPERTSAIDWSER